MRHTLNKSAAIRAVLKAARRPIPFAEFHQRVEKELQQIIGRARLKRLVSVMSCTTDPQIETHGRAGTLAYGWKK